MDLAELKCTHVSDDACKVDGNWQLVESKISKILGLAEPTTGRLKEKHDSISSDILRQSNLAMEIQILHEISKRAGTVSEAVAPESPGLPLSKHCSPAPEEV